MQRIFLDLKDDEWIKAIEVQNCGITDVGGRPIIDCLNLNKTLAVCDVSCNHKMSKKTFNHIQKMLGIELDNCEVDRKDSTIKLRDTIETLEQRLEIETSNREHANELNIQLHNKLKKAEAMKQKQEVEVPSGYLLINEEVLNTLRKQLEDLKQDKRNRDHERYQSIVELGRRWLEQSSCINSDTSLQTIRNNQRMSRIIQEEYSEPIVADVTEVSNSSEVHDVSTSEAETPKPNKNKMKSVYTMLNEPIKSSGEETLCFNSN